MNFINGAKLRRLIPAGAIVAVLAFSYLAPLPSDASNGVGGFGYNCGVKGYGYHDHGKPCPNRPFPGKGEGIEKFLGGAATTDTDTTTTGAGGQVNKTSEDNDVSTSVGNVDTLSTGKSRGHGKSHGHGRGHSNS